MAKTLLEFVELHAPLFLNGKNLGVKLDHKKHPGIEMAWDSDEKMLYIRHTHPGGATKTGVIPSSSVHCMVPQEAKVEAPKAATPVASRSAQVSTPQSPVHEGEGKGKTGKVVL